MDKITGKEMTNTEREARKLFKDLFSQFPQLTWAKWDMKRFPIILKAIQKAEQRVIEETNINANAFWQERVERAEQRGRTENPALTLDNLSLPVIALTAQARKEGLLRAAEIPKELAVKYGFSDPGMAVCVLIERAIRKEAKRNEAKNNKYRT